MDEKTRPNLPFWFSGPEVSKLARAAGHWFDLLKEWAIWPARQLDPETCSEPVLELIAWQRDTARFDGEPLPLYRKRVQYAYVNAVDSGSVAGFKRIFMRLGIGYVEIEERMDGIDWDIVDIQLTDSQLSQNHELLEVLIQHYGRTCRRYRWKIITPQPVTVRVTEFNNDYRTHAATVPPIRVASRAVQFGNDHQTTAIQEAT